MKTNSERANEVLKRASQPCTKTETAKNKRWITILSCCLASVIVVTSIGLGLGLGGVFNSDFISLDKMYLANFANYSAIGAGSQPGANESVVSAASGDSSGDAFLLSVDKEGKIERARYAKNPNDNGKEIPMNVSGLQHFENYTVVGFSGWSVNPNYPAFEIGPYYKKMTYVIDNHTGKLYSLQSLLPKTNYPDKEIVITISDKFESYDCFYFFTESYGISEANLTVDGLWRAYVENDQLKIEQVYDDTLGLTDGHNVTYFSDRYGNSFIIDNNISYVINRESKLNRLDDDLKLVRSLNGEVYFKNAQQKAQKFDENGNVVDTEFYSETFFYKKDLIKKDGKTNYYLKNETIYKITWEDDIKFTTEPIEIERSEEIYATTKDYIYFCANKIIYRVVITTGKIDDFRPSVPYYFTSISSDNLGNVWFTAINSDMDNVTGKIDNDGNVTTTITPNEFRVYYINPLN